MQFAGEVLRPRVEGHALGCESLPVHVMFLKWLYIRLLKVFSWLRLCRHRASCEVVEFGSFESARRWVWSGVAEWSGVSRVGGDWRRGGGQVLIVGAEGHWFACKDVNA